MPVVSPGPCSDLGLEKGPAFCAGCGTKIVDRYYLQAVDRQWHVSCLICCQCKIQLDSELTCFARDGHIYCKKDYYRLFAVKQCSRCQQGIFANELVMRARDLVFHIHCFRCAWCNAALTQGDYFGLRDELVYCRAHYEILLSRPDLLFRPATHPVVPVDDGSAVLQYGALGATERGCLDGERTPMDGGYVSFSSVGTGRKGRPRKRKNAAADMDGIGLSPMDPSACNLHLSHLDATGASQTSPPLANGQGGQRTKRMRTSFKHHQLRTMKSYFAINQNPDAKDLKQLAQKTGLSKRVLQVWFQNARAKWRRNTIKQQEGGHGSMSTDQSTPAVHGGMSSPGATSSFSEPSPVPSCGGIPSDGSLSTQQVATTSVDFESSNPMTPLLSTHHHVGSSAIHNGDGSLHLTSFHELF